MMKFILVADDEEFIRDLYEDLLSDRELLLDYDLLMGSDGQDLLDKLKRQKIPANEVHLLLTDFNMEPMNGLTLSKELRLMGYRGPIIIISGDLNLEEKLKGQLDDYILFEKNSNSVDTFKELSKIILDKLGRNYDK
jgi:CheY-like chemotaxis protein